MRRQVGQRARRAALRKRKSLSQKHDEEDAQHRATATRVDLLVSRRIVARARALRALYGHVTTSWPSVPEGPVSSRVVADVHRVSLCC